ncbi:MAG: Hpt domain-containing protein [Gemmatimonadales bacterium]
MASGSNGTTASRAGRSASRERRSKPLRLRDWSLRRSTGIAFVAAAVGLILLAGFASWRAKGAVTELERTQSARLASQLRDRLEQLTTRSEARLRDVAFSDALYADLGRLAERPDTTYRPSFVERLVWSGGERFVGLYTLEGRNVFRWSAASVGIDSSVVSNPIFRILDNGEPAAGLLWREGRLYWVAGAPVLPAGGSRTGPIRGYLVTARPLSGGDLAGDFGGAPRVELTEQPASREPSRTSIASFAGGDSIRVDFAVADLFAEQNTLASVRSDRAAFRAVESNFQLLLLFTLLAIAGLTLGGWWLTNRWLVRPVTRFAAALAPAQAGHTPAMLTAPASGPEWQTAAGSVNRLLAHVRVAQERFERLFGAARDGVWELDLSTRTWTFSQRVADLLGYAEASLPETTSLIDLVAPDDRAALDQAIERAATGAGPLQVEVRLVQPSGRSAWYRVEGVVHPGPSGPASLLVGRVVPLDEEHAARDAVEGMRAHLLEAERTLGRTLQGLARRAESNGFGEDLEFVGQGWAESIEADPQPFDLHQLLQELAELASPPAQVAVAPGVPTRVLGDRALVERALRPLVRNAIAAGGPLWLRAERLSGAGPDTVRLVVENQRHGVDGETLARMQTLLETGSEPDNAAIKPAAIGLRVTHRAVTALSGSAGATSAGDAGTQVWLVLELKAAPEEFVDTGMPHVQQESFDDWDDPSALGKRPQHARISGSQFRPATPEPKVELVADATVTIDFDEPPPSTNRTGQPVGAAFLAQLAPGPERSELAAQLARAFLLEAPARLAELREAASESKLTTARALAENLTGMAKLIGADGVAAACEGVGLALDAGEPADLERSLTAVAQTVGAVVAALRALVPATAEPDTPEARPAIDPSTLEQLRDALASDGAGMGSQLVSLFLAEAPLRVAALERAIAEGDSTGIGRSADDLRGMSALVGATPLSERCGALPEPDPEARRAWMQSVAAELSRAERALEIVLHARSTA